MHRIYIIALFAAVCLPHSAFAQETVDGMMKKQTFKRVVASGITNQLAFFVWLCVLPTSHSMAASKPLQFQVILGRHKSRNSTLIAEKRK
jgi:hypothetical protein